MPRQFVLDLGDEPRISMTAQGTIIFQQRKKGQRLPVGIRRSLLIPLLEILHAIIIIDSNYSSFPFPDRYVGQLVALPCTNDPGYPHAQASFTIVKKMKSTSVHPPFLKRNAGTFLRKGQPHRKQRWEFAPRAAPCQHDFPGICTGHFFEDIVLGRWVVFWWYTQ